jgi:hypothetical protein
MIVDKLKRLMDKYNLTNIIKILVILIILFILSRLFIPINLNNINLDSINLDSINFDNIEGFQTLGYSSYGNQLALQDPTNTPIYAGNTCTFKFDSVYRIEGLTLKFNSKNNVSSLSNSITSFNPDNIKTIYIQYEDGNGNMRYIKSSVNSSPPNFYNTIDLTSISTNSGTKQHYTLRINDITDENNLVVFTSKIIVIIGDSSNKIDTYIDNCNIGYISNFAFWGSSRDMLSRKDFENLSGTLSLRTFASSSSNYDDNTKTDSYTYTTTTDFLLYGITLNYNILPINPITTQTNRQTNNKTNNKLSCNETTNSPFKIGIIYNNGLYVGNNFTINNVYTIRNDPLRIITSTNTEYIIFAQPIIANKLIITVPRVNTTDVSQKILKLNCLGLQGYGSSPTTTNITDYQRTVNALLSANSQGHNLDICPSVDDLVVKQNQAQQICDNLEYQDRVKSEKLRLERNKQYLLKLQQQQQQIDQLNQVIETLDKTRTQRAQTADVARILQFQNQKGISSTVRDLANQRLETQNNNQLYLDVNINGS